MSKWKSLNTIYLYDGTFNGLLTIVFDCYLHKILPADIVDQNTFQVDLLSNYQVIQTNEKKAKRIFDGIQKSISFETLYHNYHAFLSVAPQKEMAILKYLCLGFSLGPKVDSMLSVDFILKVQKLRKRVLYENQKLKGLTRFVKIDQNLYYASLHPTNHLIELLGNHFIRRLPTQNFILHDKNRNLAFLYNTKEYTIEFASYVSLPTLSEEEQYYQSLWKTFWKTIAIKERTNPRLQMQFMPKKYWKDLIEMS